MATIKDVAERAGVAPSTVSYVLSGARKVSEDTRQAVHAAIEELGYHPRASARTLRSARTRVLALAVPRVAGEYRAIDGRFAVDVTDAARVHDHDVLLITDADGIGGLRRVARSGLADAAVLMAVEERDPRIEVLHELGFPAALLGHDGQATLPSTDLDWEAAVALALLETATAGHRRIVFLSSAEHEIAARRGYALRGLDGAQRAALEAGVDVRVVSSHRNPTVLGRRLREALSASPAPTALVVQHLILLPHLLDAVTSAERRIPEDLSVVLVGSLPDELGVRHLPRIDLPVAEMSATVTRLAIEAVELGHSDPKPSTSPRHTKARTSHTSAATSHHPIEPRMAGPAIAPPPSD
ncbi:LacI family DNA-binding transcriptional regulator [Streptomyces sp. NPDC058964]|uniref:LacI family DNA-binding transcriptional regulator n=1 Tax=Streptomyces sp. NPDC058964 TaxID=3346681 RepID=UPI0036AF1BA7